MDQQLLLAALLVASLVGFLAALLVLRRQRREREDETRESPIAMSSEGMKLCPHCAAENMWTDTSCVVCRRHLPDAPPRTW
jgi:hypothetical protein